MSDGLGTVETPRYEYTMDLPRWTLTRDVVNLRVKEKREAYLPYPATNPPSDPVAYSARYNPYILRAYIAGYTKRTVDTLVGAAFKVEPTLKNLPTQMNELAQDATGTGLTIDQLAKATTRTTMITGRAGLYTSYPSVDEGATAADTNGVMPTISLYNAEDIYNWSDDDTLICLFETYDRSEDEFVQDMGKQCRVLRLREEGATSQVYRDDGEPSEEMPLIDGYGVQWQKIPFEWVGSANNDNVVDESMVYPIAEINLGQYRNSADQEENAHIHGQTTTWITSDLRDDQIAEMYPNGIEMGARSAHYIGQNGSVTTTTAAANGLIETIIQSKESMMVQLGAKIIKDSANETAESVRIQAASETANLSSLVRNVSSATEESLKNCAQYMGIDGSGIEYDISQDFFDSTIDPQMILAMIQLYDRGVIGDEELTEPMRKAGWIKRTWQAIRNEVELRLMG